MLASVLLLPARQPLPSFLSVLLNYHHHQQHYHQGDVEPMNSLSASLLLLLLYFGSSRTTAAKVSGGTTLQRASSVQAVLSATLTHSCRLGRRARVTNENGIDGEDEELN